MFEPGGGGGLDMACKTKKKKNCKRRFTDEQVRSLETMFENETKLEPRQKAEVASQLGFTLARWPSGSRTNAHDGSRSSSSTTSMSSVAATTPSPPASTFLKRKINLFPFRCRI